MADEKSVKEKAAQVLKDLEKTSEAMLAERGRPKGDGGIKY